MAYLTSWHDSGRTEEPCPKCGRNLYWLRSWDYEKKKSLRALGCHKKKCGYRGKGTLSNVKGWTDMERFNARMR